MKYYNFELILYYDSKSYDFVSVLDTIKKTSNYAFILHDKDIDDSGKPIKAHYHVLIFFITQHTISAVSKALGVPQNDIKIIKNKVGAIQYLIHKNNPEKYQYDFNDISSNLDISKYFNNKIDSENQVIYDIMNYVKSSEYINLATFYDFILNNNYWPYYRRNAFPINNLIQQHNIDYLPYKSKKV